jgi:hypothetical protein
MGYSVSIHDLLSAHRAFLQNSFPQRHQEFERILADNIDGAQAEAAAFSLIQQLSWMGITPGTPSPDFVGTARGRVCGVEVTALSVDSVQSASEWPEDGGPYRPIYELIASAIESKVKQVSSFDGPRIICVCSSHPGARELLGEMAADRVLRGETKIGFQLGVPGAAPHEILDDLRGSAFIVEDLLGQASLRKDVSAVLLLCLRPNLMQVVGVLHHDCHHPLDATVLPGIPLGRISAHLPDGTVEVMWSPSRETASFPYVLPEQQESSRRA